MCAIVLSRNPIRCFHLYIVLREVPTYPCVFRAPFGTLSLIDRGLGSYGSVPLYPGIHFGELLWYNVHHNFPILLENEALDPGKAFQNDQKGCVHFHCLGNRHIHGFGTVCYPRGGPLEPRGSILPAWPLRHFTRIPKTHVHSSSTVLCLPMLLECPVVAIQLRLWRTSIIPSTLLDWLAELISIAPAVGRH